MAVLPYLGQLLPITDSEEDGFAGCGDPAGGRGLRANASVVVERHARASLAATLTGGSSCAIRTISIAVSSGEMTKPMRQVH